MMYGERQAGRPNDVRNFVHKRLFGAAKGFVTGGVTGAIGGFLTAGEQRQARQQTQQVVRVPGVRGVVQRILPGGATGFEVRNGGRDFSPQIRPRGVGAVQFLTEGRSQASTALQTTEVKLCCPGGMHANKADYFVKRRDANGNFVGGHDFVAEGSRCVANRRRNPLNPRALSRAMARTDSAVSIVDRLLPAPSRRASRKRTRKRKRRTSHR